MRPVTKPLMAVAVAVIAAAACSGDDAQTSARSSGTVATETTVTDAPSASDGILTIGALLPQTGEGAALGIPGTTAASNAVDLINAAGGVFGEDVRFVREDEGDSIDSAGAAIERLLDSDVDAIVGPASSLVALEYLDDLMDARVLTCSPLATAMALDSYPERELFFRTINSDSTTADGIAVQAQRTGVTTATVVYVDDAFGRPFARSVITSLTNRQVELVAEVPLRAGDTDFATTARELAASEPGTLILIADSNRGWAMLAALAEEFDDPPRIVVNDALREPPSAEQVEALPVEFRSAIEGVSPFGSPDAGEPVGPFATNSHDCVNLIALAAVRAGTDESEAVAGAIRTVANRGAGCDTFEACVEQLDDNRDIDYNGPRGRFSIAASGDPGLAHLMLFGFNELGLAVDLGAVRIPD